MAVSCLFLLVLTFSVLWLVWLWLVWLWRSSQPPQSQPAATKTTLQRLLKPRTPDDCPQCRQEKASSAPEASTRSPIRPWSEVKGHRGRPKQIDTQGFACDNPACVYLGITNSQVHALVGDGAHGKLERIQTFRCQACGSTFSSRRYTPLYRLKTASARVAEVLAALAEGLDVSAAVRVFGHSEATITRWLRRAGQHGETLQQRCFLNLCLPHLQLDEIRTRLRSRDQVLWLWLAFDPLSKLIPVLQLGPRTQDAAHSVIHELYQRLMLGCLPVFTSDGLSLYYYALTAHFGRWIEAVGHKRPQWRVDVGLIYGQVKKGLPTTAPGSGELPDAGWRTGGVQGQALDAEADGEAKHRVCRAGEPGGQAERGWSGQADLVDGTAEVASPASPRVVESLLPLRQNARVAAS